jgi:hypothetical protein
VATAVEKKKSPQQQAAEDRSAENEAAEERRKERISKMIEDRKNGVLDDENFEYEPVLTLSTKHVKRPQVEIDGELYDLKLYKDFGIEDQHSLHYDGIEFDKLWQKHPLNSSERKRLKGALDRMYEKVFVAPAKVKNNLGDDMKQEIVKAFTYAPVQMAVQRALAQERNEEETPEDETTPEPETLDT